MAVMSASIKKAVNPTFGQSAVHLNFVSKIRFASKACYLSICVRSLYHFLPHRGA
ncbi:hypothetical protein MARINOS108_120095 [Marinoscillum sp. 108]|nr:hypothetical protein MARINOS108_120095 [Marinoscillum sp. 108]